MTTKQEIQKLVRTMPADCTFEDVQHRLFLAAKVRRAARSIDQGRGIGHARLKKRLAKWLSR
jgi:hypothetical protein